eukprot:JP448278.1.p2 GENE.JP448278.1~~JP448278.1.p2  ORF type:complete len:61 (+),score=11.04 JP448278.1:93-275(+)
MISNVDLHVQPPRLDFNNLKDPRSPIPSAELAWFDLHDPRSPSSRTPRNAATASGCSALC